MGERGQLGWVFQAMALQEKNGYQVWEAIDTIALQIDIDERLQYKIVSGNVVLCIFSIQHNDPFIWRDRGRDDAIHIHRIAVNLNFKGQQQFQRVLNLG